MVLTLSILGSIFSLGGNILIALKKRSGWCTWIAGNIAWILVNFLGEMNVPMVLMYIAYLVINIAGFVSWANTPQTTLHEAINASNEAIKDKPRFDFSNVKVMK